MNNTGIQLRISDLLFAVQKRWKIIASLTLMGLVFGFLLSGMNYVQSAVESYEINGSFIIAAVDSQGRYSGNSTAPSRTDITMATDLYDSVYYLLRSDRLLYQIINDEQLLGVSASDIRNSISISQYNETNIITMRMTWDNGEEGMMLWQAILDNANKLLPQVMQVGRLRILNEPEVKLVSSRTANIKTWMILPVLGFGAGMGFSIIELLMHPTLINVKDVETVLGLETIGLIPHDSEFFKNRTSMLVEDEYSSSEVTQSYSAAAYILRNRIGYKDKCHCFYITSATGQEGRTTLAANLAIQLSDMERKTLVIDFDYKNPTLGSLFLSNIDYNRSLNSLYRGEINLDDAITTLTGYLDLLPMVMEHNLIYLDNSIAEMITQLKERYNYIIIDAPPVGKESETLSLNQVANAVLFVVRYDTASIPEIQSALEKLDKSGTRVLGCVVNAVQTTKNVLMGVGKKGADKKETAGKKKKTSNTKKKKAKKAKKPPEQPEKQEKKENEEALLAMTSWSRQDKPPEAAQAQNAGAAEAVPQSAPPQDAVPAQGAPEEATVTEADFDAAIREAISGPDMGVGEETQAEPPKAPDTEKPEPILQAEWTVRDADGTDTHFTPELPALPPETDAEGEKTAPQEIAPNREPAQEAKPESSPEPPKKPQRKPGLFGRKPKEPAPSRQEKKEKEKQEKQEKQPKQAKKPEKPEKPGKPEKPAKKEKKPAKSGLFAAKGKPAKSNLFAEKDNPLQDSLLDAVEKPAKHNLFDAIEEPAGSEKPKAPPAKAASAKPKKSGGLFSAFGKSKKKKPAPLSPVNPEATVIKKPRDVFEDLDDTSDFLETRAKSDAEITEELLRMGLDGSWTEAGASKPEEGAKPKSNRKNIFDDL